jgi:hypothetical protein
MPNGAPPTLKELAKRLLADEARADKQRGANQSAAFRVCEKLRHPLGKLLGMAGFRALFSRALALANEEVPWLRALHIKADGSLEGLDELEANLDENEIVEGEVVLVARLLELLITFIGPALTVRIIQDAWPRANFDDLDIAKELSP